MIEDAIECGRRIYGKGAKWLSSDLELLQKLIDDGMTLEDISIQIEDETGVKRSVMAIEQAIKVNKLNPPVNKDMEELIKYVREHYLTETPNEMSFNIGRSMNIIGRIMRHNKWKTPEDVSAAYKKRRYEESMKYKNGIGKYKASLCWYCQRVADCERWHGKKVWDEDEEVMYFSPKGWMPTTAVRKCSYATISHKHE